MAGLLIAIVGDANPNRTFNPPMANPAQAKQAAEELGGELARRNGRLLVYGGPFLEEDVVRGFVAGKPAQDRCILMWYTQNQTPPPFPEEATHPNLFQRRAEKGSDWEVGFYRSITRADGVVLIGGDNATKISGQVAIGTRLPMLALAEFGGGAAKVWETLSAGEDLPNRDEIDLMARPWAPNSAAACVDALFAQHERRQYAAGAPKPILSILAGVLFLAGLAIVAWVWGRNSFEMWMLFAAGPLAGGAGAAIRPAVDRLRGAQDVTQAVIATIVLGVLAGGIAGVLFVAAQFMADPKLASDVDYARRSIPFAFGVGFVAGLTADAVFGKLIGVDVTQTSAIAARSTKI